MKRIYFFTLALVILFTSVAFAEKSEYKNDKYNASHIKNIILLCGVPSSTSSYVYDPYISMTFPDVIVKELSEDRNIKITMFADIVKKVNQENNCDIMAAYDADPAGANKLMQKYIDKYDAYLVVNILQYGTGSQYRPEFAYNTTQYSTSTVTTSTGEFATITTPQTVTHTIPAGLTSNATAAFEFNLRDTKTNETIFARTESRTRESDLFSTADPKDIAKRISDNYVHDLLDKIHNDLKVSTK